MKMDKIFWMQLGVGRYILICYAMRNSVRARVSTFKYVKILGELKSNTKVNNIHISLRGALLGETPNHL